MILGAVAAISAAVVLGWLFTAMRQKTTTKLALLGAAAGEAEAHLWIQRLQSAGIWVRVANVGDSMHFTSPYAYELWVRVNDVHRARKLLGIR